jgi:NAD-dependent deacetylase
METDTGSPAASTTARRARPDSVSAVSANVENAAALLAGAQRILVFTGAGISTESGIPDFRGPSGLWKTADPADYSLANYVASAEFRHASWERRFDSPLNHAAPNAAHHAVVALWDSGRMLGCITQNIDGLHLAAGLPTHAVVEFHGNRSGIRCLDCGADADPEAVEARWRAGERDPACTACGGILKTTIVYFGEMLPERALIRASMWSAAADAVIVVGSSLTVYPAAAIPLEVAGRGAPLVIVNEEPTEHDAFAGAVLSGKAGTLLPGLVALLAG